LEAKIVPGREGQSLIEINRSRFIGLCRRISSTEEASALIDSQRQKYPDARHCCYAWILSGGLNMQKYSDDGEPSGTAGMPILSVLSKNGISDTAITVTRYFGGVLLGKGGLVRAYTEAAAEALKDSAPSEIIPGELYKFPLEYKISDRVIFELGNRGFEITDTAYGENVVITVLTPEKEAGNLLALVTEITSGKVSGEKAGSLEMNSGKIIDF